MTHHHFCSAPSKPKSSEISRYSHSHNPHLDDGCVNFLKDFLKVLSKISFLDFDKFSKIISEFERFLCEIFSNLAKKFQNLESISCVQLAPYLLDFPRKNTGKYI